MQVKCFSFIDNKLTLNKIENGDYTKPYQSLLQKLMYIMLCLCPDVCFALSFFGTFQKAALYEHFNHLLRVLQYLNSTENYSLKFSSNNNNNNNNQNYEFCGYADSDFANDINDRKLITRYCFKLFDNLISYTSRKQKTVALSTTEAELYALVSTGYEMLHLK